MNGTCVSPSTLSTLIPTPIVIIDSDSNEKIYSVERGGATPTTDKNGMKGKAEKAQYLIPPRVPLGKIAMQLLYPVCSSASDLVLLDDFPIYLETYPNAHLAPRSRKFPKATPRAEIVSTFRRRTPTTLPSSFQSPYSPCASEPCSSSSPSSSPSLILLDEIGSAPLFFTFYPSVSDEEDADLSIIPAPSFAMSMMGGVMEMAEEFVPPRRRELSIII